MIYNILNSFLKIVGLLDFDIYLYKMIPQIIVNCNILKLFSSASNIALAIRKQIEWANVSPTADWIP